MSKAGLVSAREHAEKLPTFRSLDESRLELFARRDRDLAALIEAAQRAGQVLNSTPDALRTLEAWYFQLADTNGFQATGLKRPVFERAIPAYFGEVLVRTAGFEWVVEEFAFAPGRYEFGVRRGGFTFMLSVPWDLVSRPKNKRHDSLWREYRKHAA